MCCSACSKTSRASTGSPGSIQRNKLSEFNLDIFDLLLQFVISLDQIPLHAPASFSSNLHKHPMLFWTSRELRSSLSRSSFKPARISFDLTFHIIHGCFRLFDRCFSFEKANPVHSTLRLQRFGSSSSANEEVEISVHCWFHSRNVFWL